MLCLRICVFCSDGPFAATRHFGLFNRDVKNYIIKLSL